MQQKRGPLNSASQINTFEDCERKFGWKYLAGEKDPPGKAAELGTEVDEGQLQPWLRDGRPFEMGRESGSGEIAESALEWLPAPKSPGLAVQKHFVLGSAIGDWAYQGYKDLWLPSHTALPYLPRGEGDWPAVVDFKTTSDFAWAKSEEALSKDVQAQLYAMNAMVETGARVVDLVWIYMRTRGARKSKKVHLRVVADQVGEQFDRIESVSEKMFALRGAAKGEDAPKFVVEALRPNPDACDKYGGCPYQHLCNLSPKEKSAFSGALLKPLGRSGMGTLNLLGGLAKKAGVALPQNVMGMPDTAVPEPAGATAFDAPAAEPVQVKVLGINPPEKNLPPAPPVGVTSAGESKPKRGRPSKKTGAELTAEMVANATPVVAAPAAATPAVQTSGGIDFKRMAVSFEAMAAVCQSLADTLKGAA